MQMQEAKQVKEVYIPQQAKIGHSDVSMGAESTHSKSHLLQPVCLR